MARKPTWIEIAVARKGFREASRALSWAYTWAITRAVLGHDPSAEEVARDWAASQRTTYREKASFHNVFPELDDPSPLFRTARAKEMIESHARAAKKLSDWGNERKAKHAAKEEASLLEIGLGTATGLRN